MADDPNAPPLSDTASSTTAESSNRPEPALESPTPASESAGTQQQSASTDTESASAASEDPQTQPAHTTEAVATGLSQQPEGEAVSQSTQPVSKPPTEQSGTPEADQENRKTKFRRPLQSPRLRQSRKLPSLKIRHQLLALLFLLFLLFPLSIIRSTGAIRLPLIMEHSPQRKESKRNTRNGASSDITG